MSEADGQIDGGRHGHSPKLPARITLLMTRCNSSHLSRFYIHHNRHGAGEIHFAKR